MYHPLKGQAVNCSPPQSSIILETAGTQYHFKPRSLMPGYLYKCINRCAMKSEELSTTCLTPKKCVHKLNFALCSNQVYSLKFEQVSNPNMYHLTGFTLHGEAMTYLIQNV